MALFRPSLDYTDIDFDALLARAEQLISAAFPTWTDKNVADFGNILVNLICFVGDTNTFYQNKQARETRWTQATQRKNLLALVKLIGFVPAGAVAATAEETFTLSVAMTGAVTLPLGTKVSTRDLTAPTRYQLTEDLIILAGQTVAVATVEQSEFQSDTFVSTGLANQSFTLGRTPYLPDSLTIIAANGTFVQVDNLLLSTGTDPHFVVVVDQNDRARVDFGNGINGAIPSGNLIANYKTGGGAAGRVEAGALSKLDGTFVDAFGNPATFTVTNVLQSTPGADRQTNASIRQRAPETVRQTDRSIAREDYELVGKSFEDLVSRALMMTRNEDPTIPENSGILFLVPPGAGTLPDSTVTAVRAGFVTKPYAPTFQLAIQGASYLLVNVHARVYLTAGILPAVAKANVLASLGFFFEDIVSDATSDDFGAVNSRIDFGYYIQRASGEPDGTLALTDVQNAVRDTIGVRKIDSRSGGFLLNGSYADVPILNRQFPKLGTVTIVNADTGVVL